MAGISSKMSQGTSEFTDRLYREERSYRADRLIEKWKRIPELGVGLSKMGESDARNLAISLENQSRYLTRMSEAQRSSGFQGMSPENMLRLVRLVYPNTIRNKLFTEFAMETTKDSIKYIRPVYTNNQGINNDVSGHMDDRTFGDWNLNGDLGLNSDNYRKAMYERSDDRYVQELSNGTTIQGVGGLGGDPVDQLTVSYTTGAFALGYIDGYSAVFLNTEKNPLALQDKSGVWYFTPYALTTDGAYAYKLSNATQTGSGTFTFSISIASVTAGVVGSFAPASAPVVGAFKTFGRYNSEGDFTGDYLGEVELVMTDYQFNPRPLTLGLTWSQMTELVLDNSFGVSAEELLMDYAGQEIKKAQDFRAVKIAYNAALSNPSTYTVNFNAASGDSTDDSYLATAQTFSQAIARVGDVMLNDIQRGGVTRIVGGPAAISYLALNSSFTEKGRQSPIGAHQYGELGGIPVFKVPSNVIPDNELVTVWKNDANEADVSLAFGTLVPFFSTGTIQRKNLYKEGAIASYEDYNVLQRKYFGKIQINGLRQLS